VSSAQLSLLPNQPHARMQTLTRFYILAWFPRLQNRPTLLHSIPKVITEE